MIKIFFFALLSLNFAARTSSGGPVRLLETEDLLCRYLSEAYGLYLPLLQQEYDNGRQLWQSSLSFEERVIKQLDAADILQYLTAGPNSLEAAPEVCLLEESLSNEICTTAAQKAIVVSLDLLLYSKAYFEKKLHQTTEVKETMRAWLFGWDERYLAESEVSQFLASLGFYPSLVASEQIRYDPVLAALDLPATQGMSLFA